MAAALDPKFAFHWLQDHPGTTEDKDAVRHTITSRPSILNDFEQYGVGRFSLNVIYTVIGCCTNFHLI
jgi:hypothetical protein